MGSLRARLQTFDPQPAVAKAREWFIVDSNALAEPILCVPDPADLPAAKAEHPRLVPYLMREVDTLYSHRDNPELLQAVHRIKKHLGGHVRSKEPTDA